LNKKQAQDPTINYDSLELLKSDEEFRLAVAGLLGLATTPFCGEGIYSVF